MLSKAFSEDYVKSSTVVWIPKHIGLNNVKLALDYLKYGTTIWNTLSLSIIAALIQVVSSAVIGYGFARYNFKGRELLFTLVILTIIVPPQTYLIPMYIGYRYFNFFYLGSLLHAIIPSIDGYINLAQYKLDHVDSRHIWRGAARGAVYLYLPPVFPGHA